ncbi:hypothetical protein [Marinomonas pollencensis]|uniref:Uncharacterized protein n=1 Tax=Marinomonas pollencensis TaxID=491954 RepID=A0A3E0DTN6_9GAMM|nr:hypothetical protein [Marinomonas pollencensis]REG86927.1 hypothetical protein DFP81_101497 [Marinomonas pollencensis]
MTIKRWHLKATPAVKPKKTKSSINMSMVSLEDLFSPIEKLAAFRQNKKMAISLPITVWSQHV